MDYELAKRLKDAGFPQTTEFFYIDGEKQTERKDTWLTIEWEWGKCREIEKVKCIAAPTLSELIEACRLESELGNTFQLSAGTKWTAGYADYGEFVDTYGEGATPEIAVAMLWLALNTSNG